MPVPRFIIAGLAVSCVGVGIPAGAFLATRALIEAADRTIFAPWKDWEERMFQEIAALHQAIREARASVPACPDPTPVAPLMPRGPRAPTTGGQRY